MNGQDLACHRRFRSEATTGTWVSGGERYTRGRKARRWSRVKVKWEMSIQRRPSEPVRRGSRRRARRSVPAPCCSNAERRQPAAFAKWAILDSNNPASRRQERRIWPDSCTESGAAGDGTGRHVVPAGSLTQHLERVGRAWPELAPQIREAILTLVEASGRPAKTQMTSPRIRSKATTICAPSTAGAR